MNDTNDTNEAALPLAAMRAVSGSATAALRLAAEAGGRSSRKALVVVVGRPGEPSSARMLAAAALDAAAGEGLPRLASAGHGGAAVDMADVLGAYDTDAELPVLFIDEESGEETLTMFLYGV